MKDEFYEFLREYTDILTKNINNTKYHTCNNLKQLIKKNQCVLLEASCVIIMNKQDCVQKLENMFHDDIKRTIYERSIDTKKQDLKLFKTCYTDTSKIALAKTKWEQSPINQQAEQVRPTNLMIMMK